ncbi:MAG: DNA-directed RNA polymerase subunit beta [Victivallaceae bacterium]|nr:DNA-directed RNA polymerase subunit beta [Victivallaceae bacterium]MDD4180332.1 DNA-directed RNA polymerase subunit beta [Victivallaceae bacterium]
MSERINYGNLKDVLEIPDLIGIQVDSYNSFLQKDTPPELRKIQGLQEIFNEIFPIESFDKKLVIEFLGYTIGEPKDNEVDCIKDGNVYSAPLHADFLLKNDSAEIRERVYMGEIPLMTECGTFVINGAERVIISQLHRSPGICFERTRHSSGRMLYSFRIIPDRGSWMEVQFDINDYIYIYLDRRRRRRKFLITTFLRTVGYETNKEILSNIYKVSSFTVTKLLKQSDISCYYTIDDVVNADGALVLEELVQLNETHLKRLQSMDVAKLELAYIPDGDNYIIGCLRRDPSRNSDEALKEIYKRMRPGDPPNLANAKLLVKRLFFDVKRYDLGVVGRHKMNERLKLDLPLTERALHGKDLMAATKQLINLRNIGGKTDDIDHLGNRRIRTVGELLQNHCRVGLLRTERLVRERMTLLDSSDTAITPNKLINPKAFAGVVRDFFARNQLSQFMDQTNSLSELTNKRRLSALGPGGLSRDRAGFEVRDVHPSHYGRVCPIETPEGPNIGLISSMSLYARINEYGFLETPYRRVVDGQVTKQIDYLTADREEEFVIAQANAPLDEKSHFSRATVMARYRGESEEHPKDEVQYMDVSPKQLVSAAAGIIPFLEHDDANRALMGSNMQRQAVPLLIAESPYVGTGLEAKIARDSRAVVVAQKAGIVAEVCASEIVITKDGKTAEETAHPDEVIRYKLKKFLRSNAGTCINQRPCCVRGKKVKVGDVIADGSSTDKGELGLGKNVLVAFMPWCGYNFEDAIIVSERLVKEDVYTSIHIDEFEITSRDTKLGPEEITRDIPNVSEDALRNLGTDGVIRLGAEVYPGDILVGKITPKSETELAPEERLLRAIFGEKAADVKDSSLMVGSGKGGIVMDVRIERSKDPNRQTLTKSELRRQLKGVKDAYKQRHAELIEDLSTKLSEVLLSQKLSCAVTDNNNNDAVLIGANRKITPSAILKLSNKYDSWNMAEDDPFKESIKEIISSKIQDFRDNEEVRDEAINALESGDMVDGGIIKKVKVYVACKRKLQVGDKMAGRHGNKGIVAKIVPIEDMPFMLDGQPVDIVLNPLGVPSRMNLGQVLETHLGIAAKILGFKVATPVFDGIKEEKIVELMGEANRKIEKETGVNYQVGFKKNHGGKWEYDGKTELFDGRTGDLFDQRVMVGQIYMLKLDHLVANKIHARSVGPYSLVTQQPLGGKAQHGGQRFGEMEVWALEAYGAAYNLQEMLTVKSDDVTGRARIYESIVRGQNILEAGRPESFNVLLKEMQSLGLDIRTVNKVED